jgi:hypothetical protein
MVRWFARLVSVVALGALATGCASLPAVGDGDLRNDWAALPAPVGYEPKVGSCLLLAAASSKKVDRLRDKVVSCDQEHHYQVVIVGQFGPEGSTPTALDTIYQQCDAAATKFIGENWRNGTLEIRAAQPESATAEFGARWWECMVLRETPYFSNAAVNQPLMRTDLAAGIPADLRFGCQRASEKDDEIVGISAVDCATPHEAEYAGAATLPVGTPFPSSEQQWRTLHDACDRVVATFVGVSLRNVRGTYTEVMRSEATWPQWRDVRCHLFFGSKTMVGSAKGTQGKGVPW